MSSIEKLLISGIRSFDPKTPSTLDLYTPLTLIVGSNGAGKTTIIECLKYACTGDFPPGTKGAAFIHDPKIAHETEVKGQVKLKFRNVNGRQMVCTRLLEATQKKNKLSHKTLESVLLSKDPKTGEQVSVSARCMDLDNDIPLHLGVSKAILDNVIFCHQEEANWPLSESNILKKKFDEIFASTKYTRALDSIKKLRKEQAIEMKIDHVRLSFQKEKKERAEKIRIELEIKYKTINDHQARIEKLKSEISEVERETAQLMEKVNTYQAVKMSLDQLTNKKKVLEEAQGHIAGDLVKFPESDEQLERLIAERRSKLSRHVETQKELEEQKENYSRKLTLLREELNSKTLERGKLEAEQAAHGRLVEARNQLIRELSQKHHFKGFETMTLSDEDIVRFTSKLQAQVKKQMSQVDSIKEEYRNRENELNKGSTQLNVAMRTHKEGKRNAEKDMKLDQQKIKSLTAKLNELKGSQADLELLENRFREEEQALNDMKARLTANGEMKSKLDAKKAELKEVDDQLQQLTMEIGDLNRQSNKRAKLELKRSEFKKKSETVLKTLESCKEEFRIRLGHDPTPEIMKHEIDVIFKKNEEAITSHKDDNEKKIRELSSIEARLSLAEPRLQQKLEQQKDIGVKITAECGDRDLPTLLAEIEDELMDARDQYSSIEGGGSLYERFMKKSKDEHKCVLCARSFGKQDELENFINKANTLAYMYYVQKMPLFQLTLRNLIDKIPAQKLQFEQNIKELEQQRDNLRIMQSQWDTLVRLKKIEIPELEQEIREQKGRMQMVASKMEEITKKITPLEEEARAISKLREKAEEIARIDVEMKWINQDIRQLENELTIAGSAKTVNECQHEQEVLQLRRQVTLGNGRKNIRSEIEARNTENSKAQEEFVERKDRVYHTMDELRKMKEQVKMRESLQENIAELQNDLKAQEECEKSLDVKIMQTQSDITSLTKQLQECRKELEGKENAAQSEVNSLQQTLFKVNNIGREIQSFILVNGTARLAECDAQAVKLKQQIVECELHIEDLGNKVSDLNKRVSEEKIAERSINDSLRFRDNQRKIADMDARIVKLQHEEVRHDPASYSLETQRLKVKLTTLNAEQSSLEGQVKQLVEQTKSFEEELRTEYFNIHEEWRKQLIKLKTSQMANADLDKYSKALDNAIARYHSMKMEELNKIIHELWIKTYQGNDIDRIEIRSESDNSVRAGAGVRSYDYRVVMIKGDTELDMRGRCSAGQKVLTAIMIRLALAETFCINCGILALDEPTTNLDKPNIESLAKSLVDIIKARRQQSNFQLIIITHDEAFSNMLGKSEFADYYWRVFKDASQYSTIEKQPISDV